MPKVLVTCAQMQAELPVHAARIREAGYAIDAPAIPGQMFTSADLARCTDDVVGIIAGDDELDRSFFEASPELRVLVRWGIGMDSVDHAAARDHGVTVRNTPGVFGGEVADSAVAYMLLLCRGHHRIDYQVRQGGWPKHEGISLSGSTVGIVGLGDIGRALGARALGFGMRVVGYDPYVDPTLVPSGVEVVGSLDDVLAGSRFVVLTCPLTDETHHLMNTDSLARMQSHAFLVNVGRGPLVDEKALAEAVRQGAIAGAGLDVFEVEPLPADSALRHLDNVILGAHNGSNTREGVARASQRAVDILLDELAR